MKTVRRYDRYWQGRTSWSDIIRSSRTFARLVWYHVPLRMGPQASQKEEREKGKERDEERAREVRRLMAEKKMALELIEGYVRCSSHDCK